MTIDAIRKFLMDYDGPQIALMEVCGSHTGAIAKFGIDGMLSEKIHLISGPGCPVCVTPTAYIDRLIELGKEPDTTIVTFGDLLRVPGSVMSLSEAKTNGCKVKMVYSPFDTLALAKDNPSENFVFAAVGFETTTPVYAALLDMLLKENIHNIRLLTAIKSMPGVIRYLMDRGAAIDGFIAPGHVSVVTGADYFLPLAKRYGIPFVVAGFGAKELLLTIYDLVRLRGQGVVQNDYPSVVTAEGNKKAKELIDTYFATADVPWRGMGVIPHSGRLLKKAYEAFDAKSADLLDDKKKNSACICDQVLMGKKRPGECPLFGTVCTPMQPQGACMVSAEGNCHSYYAYRRK